MWLLNWIPEEQKNINGVMICETKRIRIDCDFIGIDLDWDSGRYYNYQQGNVSYASQIIIALCSNTNSLCYGISGMC